MHIYDVLASLRRIFATRRGSKLFPEVGDGDLDRGPAGGHRSTQCSFVSGGYHDVALRSTPMSSLPPVSGRRTACDSERVNRASL